MSISTESPAQEHGSFRQLSGSTSWRRSLFPKKRLSNLKDQPRLEKATPMDTSMHGQLVHRDCSNPKIFQSLLFYYYVQLCMLSGVGGVARVLYSKGRKIFLRPHQTKLQSLK